jgi:hypothetical protein
MASLRWKLASMGAGVAGVALVAALVMWAGSAEQCPDDFTQAQVDASDCIVGANIGLGLVWIFVVPLVVSATAWLCVILWRRSS